MTTLMKPEEEELTTSTEDLSLPLSLDKKVWLSLRSNCRARLLNAILEEFTGGLVKRIREASWRRLAGAIRRSRVSYLEQVSQSRHNRCAARALTAGREPLATDDKILSSHK